MATFLRNPGWIRASLHPTMTDQELDQLMEAVVEISENPFSLGVKTISITNRPTNSVTSTNVQIKPDLIKTPGSCLKTENG